MASPLFLRGSSSGSLLLLLSWVLLARIHGQRRHWPPTSGLLCLHDGSNVLLVGGLLGTSLGVLVLLSWRLALLSFPLHLSICTYDVAQLLLSSFTGVLTLVTTGHLGLKGLRNNLEGRKNWF